MKAIFVFATLVCLAVGIPQRGGNCICPDVICPNSGRSACECMNTAAQNCYRQWRNPSCPSPTPMNCNGPQRPPPNNPNNGPYGWSTGSNGISTWNNGGGKGPQPSLTTYYSVVPYRVTITTTLPGFGWPNPVTSLSYGTSTTTITIVNPVGAPPPTDLPGIPRITTVTSVRSPPPKSTNRPWTPPWQVSSPKQQPPPSSQPPPPPPPPLTSQPPPPPPPPTPTSPPRQTSLAPRPPTSRPAPWTPPVESGSPWTPVNIPTIPAEPPTPVETQAPAPQPPAPPAPPAPEPPGPPGSPAKCGPGKPKCTGNTYCDPQPLCSIGEDCDGVCLPIVTFRTEAGLILSYAQQPWEKRRAIWQDMLDQGYYAMYRYSI